MNKWLIIISLITGNVYSWDLAGHREITHDVIYHEPIRTVLEVKFGYSSIQMQNITLNASVTADLDDYQGIIKWSDVESWTAFKNKFKEKEVSVLNIGLLLHEMQDAAIPIHHSPAREYNKYSDSYKRVSKFREFRFETISIDRNKFNYDQLSSNFDNLPLSGKYFTFPLSKVLLNKEITVEKSLEEIYNNMIEEFLLLTQENVQKWKDRFGDKKWSEIDYHGLRPACVDAAFTLSREIVYLYLLCHLYDAWDNPDRLLTKKVDLTPIINLLLD